MADREYGFKANFSFGADSQTRTALNDIVSQIERLAEGIRKLQADTDGAKISIDTRGVERGASKVSRSFRRTGREMGDTQDETKRIRKEFRMLAAEMMTVNYGAVENVKAREKGERQVKRYIFQIDKLTKSLRGQSAEERQLAAQMKRKTQIEKKRMETIRAQREALLATSQQSAVEAGVMTFRGVSSPIFGEIRKSAQIYANFDAKLREVSAKSGATEAESKELKKKAQALAISTRYSATQVAEAEVFLAQAGFKTGKLTAEGEKLNEITAALPEVLNLATSGTLELGEAADIASNVLSAFSLSAEETGRVSDALAKIANTTNTTVHNMGEAFAYAGAPAAAFGMTIEDVSSMLGMMGNMGIQATSGGTAIRAGAINLLNEKKAAKLKEIGVNVVDEAGEIRDIKDIMGDLWRAFGMDKDPKIVEDLKRAAAAGEDLDAALEGVPGKAKQLSIMSDVFGKPAISGWLALLTQYEGWMDSHRSIAKENEGYGGKVAKEMAAGLEGSLASLESAIEGFRLAFIEPLIPTIQLFTDLITNITRAFAGLPMPIRMAASNLTLLVGLMAGAAAVIGGTTLLLSGFRTAVLTGKAAMVAFGGATAQAHSNLVFAEQSLNAYSFSGIKTFRPLFDSVRGYIVKAKEFSLIALTQIRVAIAAAHTSMMGLITPWRLMALAVLGFVYVLQSLTPEVSLFGGAIARLVPLLGFFRGLMEGIFGEEAVARYGESVKSFADLLTSPFRFVTDQVELFKKTVSDAFAGEAYKNAKNLGYLLGTVISQRVALAWDSTVGRIVSWLNHLVEFARKVGNLLIGALNCNPTEKIPAAWEGGVGQIVGGLLSLLVMARLVGPGLAAILGRSPASLISAAWVQSIFRILGSLTGMALFAKTIGRLMIGALNCNPTEKIPLAWAGMADSISDLLTDLLFPVRYVGSLLAFSLGVHPVEIVRNAWEGAIALMGGNLGGFLTFAQNVGDWLVDALNHNPTEKIPEAWDGATEEMRGGLWGFLRTAREVAGSVFSALTSPLTAAATALVLSPLGVVLGMLQTQWTNFVNAMMAGAGALADAIVGMWLWVMSPVTTPIVAGFDVAQRRWESFASSISESAPWLRKIGEGVGASFGAYLDYKRVEEERDRVVVANPEIAEDQLGGYEKSLEILRVRMTESEAALKDAVVDAVGKLPGAIGSAFAYLGQFMKDLAEHMNVLGLLAFGFSLSLQSLGSLTIPGGPLFFFLGQVGIGVLKLMPLATALGIVAGRFEDLQHALLFDLPDWVIGKGMDRALAGWSEGLDLDEMPIASAIVQFGELLKLAGSNLDAALTDLEDTLVKPILGFLVENPLVWAINSLIAWLGFGVQGAGPLGQMMLIFQGIQDIATSAFIGNTFGALFGIVAVLIDTLVTLGLIAVGVVVSILSVPFAFLGALDDTSKGLRQVVGGVVENARSGVDEAVRVIAEAGPKIAEIAGGATTEILAQAEKLGPLLGRVPLVGPWLESNYGKLIAFLKNVNWKVVKTFFGNLGKRLWNMSLKPLLGLVEKFIPGMAGNWKNLATALFGYYANVFADLGGKMGVVLGYMLNPIAFIKKYRDTGGFEKSLKARLNLLDVALKKFFGKSPILSKIARASDTQLAQMTIRTAQGAMITVGRTVGSFAELYGTVMRIAPALETLIVLGGGILSVSLLAKMLNHEFWEMVRHLKVGSKELQEINPWIGRIITALDVTISTAGKVADAIIWIVQKTFWLFGVIAAGAGPAADLITKAILGVLWAVKFVVAGIIFLITSPVFAAIAGFFRLVSDGIRLLSWAGREIWKWWKSTFAEWKFHFLAGDWGWLGRRIGLLLLQGFLLVLPLFGGPLLGAIVVVGYHLTKLLWTHRDQIKETVVDGWTVAWDWAMEKGTAFMDWYLEKWQWVRANTIDKLPPWMGGQKPEPPGAPVGALGQVVEAGTPGAVLGDDGLYRLSSQLDEVGDSASEASRAVSLFYSEPEEKKRGLGDIAAGILAVGFTLAVVLASLGASVAGISLAPLLLLGTTVAGIIYAIASAGEVDGDWFKNLITHPVATLKGWHDQVMSLWAEMASLVTAPLAPGLADQVGSVVHTVIEAIPVIFLAILGLSLVLKKNLAGVLIDIVRVVFTLIGGMGKLANTNVAFGATTKGMEALQTLQGGDNKRRATLIKERKALGALRAEYQRYIDKQAKKTIHRSRFGNAQEKAALAGLVEQKERGVGPFKWKYHRLNAGGMEKMRERAERHFFEEAGGVGKLRSAKGVARKMRGVEFSDDQIKTFVTSHDLGPLAEVADLLEERNEIKKQVVHSADFGSATFKDVNGVNLGVVQAAKEGGGGATSMERDLEQSAIQMRKLREELFKAVATRRENAGTDSKSAIARAQADDRIAAATRAIAREYGDLEKRYRDLKVPKVLESITPGKPEEYLDLLDARSTVAADYRSQGLSPEQIQQKKMSGVYEKDVARALKERAGYGYEDTMADMLYELEQVGADDKQKEALIAVARKRAMRFQNRSRLIDEGAIQNDALDRGLSGLIADIADTEDPERWLSTLHSMLTVGEGRGDLTRAQVMENTKLKADAAALLDRIRKTVDQGGSSETLKKSYLNEVIALYGRIGDYQLKQLMLLESVADQELQIASEVAKQRGGVGKFFKKLIPKRLKQVGKADDIRSRRREAAGGIAPFTEAEVAALEIAEADLDSASIREKYSTYYPEEAYPYYDEVRKEDERDYVTWAGGEGQKKDFGALLTQVGAKSSSGSPGKEALGYRALLSQEYGGNWAVGDPNAQLPLLEGIRQEKMKQVVEEALRAVEAAGLSGDGAGASELLREKLGEGVAKIKGDLETVAKRYRESLTAYATAVEPILGKEEVQLAVGEAEKKIRKIEKAAAGIEAVIVAGLPDGLAQSSGKQTKQLIEKSLQDLEQGEGNFNMGIAGVYDQFSGSVMGLHNTIARMAIVYEEAADEISDLTLPDDGGWRKKAGEAITDFRRQLFGVKPKKKGKDVADDSRAIADQIFKAKRVFAAARGVDVSKPFGGDSMDFPLYAQARKGDDEGDALYLKAMGTGVQAASLYRRYQDAVGTPEGQKYARAINQYLIPILSTTGIREGELDKQLNNFKSRSRNPENQRVYAEIEKVLSSMYGLGGEGGEGAMKQLAVVLQGVKTKDGSPGADAIASSMRKFATRRVFADPTGNQTGAVAALADNLDRFLSGVEYKLNSEGRSKAAAELMADEALFSQLKHQMARVGEIASPEAATQADVARFLKNFVPAQRPAGGGTSYIKDIVGGLAQWNITGGGELAPEMARALEAFEGSSGAAALDWKVGYEDNPTFQALARLVAGTSTTEEEALRIRQAFADIGLEDFIDDAHQSAQTLKALLNVDGKQRIGNMEAAVAGILDTFPTAAELRNSPAGEEINPIVTALESLDKYKKLENFGIRSWATFPELKVEDEVGQVVLGLMRNEEKAVELLRDMDREQKDIVEGIATAAMHQAGLDTDAVSMLGIDPKLARKAKSVRREQSYRWLELAQVTEEPDYGKRGWKRKAGVAPKLNPKVIDELVTELEKLQGGGFIDRNAVEAFLRNPAAIAGASAGRLGPTQADAIREFLQSRVGAREAELKKEADKALKEFKDSGGVQEGGVKASKAALKALDVRSFQEQKKVQPKESLKDTARNLERAMKTGGRGADPVTAAAIWLRGRTGDAVGEDLKKIAAQAKKAAAKAGKALEKEREAAKDRRAEMLNLAIRSLSDNKKGLDRVIEDLTSSGEARDQAIARALETYKMTGVLGGEILPSGQADAMFKKTYDKNAKKPSEAKAAWEALRKRFAVPDPESVALFAALEDILSTTGMTEGFKGLSDDLLNKKTGDGIDLFDEIATQKITAVKKISDQLAYLENKTNKTKEDLGQIEYLKEQRELGREHAFVTLDQPILAKKIAEAKRDRTLTEEAAQTKGRQETAKAMANYTQWMSRENAEEFREMLQSGETIDRAKFEEWANEIAREQLKGAGMQPKEVEEVIRHLGKTLAKGSKGRKWGDSGNPMPNPLQTAVDALRNIQKLYGEAERSGDKQSLLLGIRSDSWAAKYKKLGHRQDYQDLVPILHQAGLLDLNEGKIDLTQKDSGIREFLTQASEATKRILLNFVATGEYMRDSGVELEEILKALGMAEADIDRVKKDPIWKRLATKPEEYAQSPYTADSRSAAVLEAQLRRRQPDKDRERAIAEMEAPEPTTWAGELAKSIRWWLGLPGRTAKFLQDEVTREATRLKGAWVGFQSKVRGTIDWTKEWPLIGENYVFPFLDGAYNFARDLKNGAAKFAEETKEWGRLRALDLAAPFRGLAAAVVEGFGGAAEDFSADEDLGAHRWRSVAAGLLEHTGFTQIGDWRRKRRAERKISAKGMDYSADLGDLSAQAGYSTGAEMVAELKEQFAGLAVESIELTKAVARSGYRDPGEYFANEILPAILSDKPGAIAELIRKQTEEGNAHVAQAVVQSLGKTLDIGEEIMKEIANSEKLVVKLRKNFFDFVPFFSKGLWKLAGALFGNPLSKVATADIPPAIRQLNNLFSFVPEVVKLQRLKLKRGAISKGFAIGIRGINWLSKSGLFPGMVEKMRNRFIDFTKNLNDETARSLEETRARLREIRNSGALHILAGLKNLFGTLFGAIGGLLKFAGTKVKERFQKWQQSRRSRVTEARPDPTEAERQSAIDKTFRRQQGLARRKERSAALKRQREAASAAQAAALVKEIQSRTRGRPPAAALKPQREADRAAQAAALAKEIQSRTRDRPPPVVPRIEPPPPVPGSGIGGGVTDRKPRWQREPESRKPPPSSIPRLERAENRTEDLVPGFPELNQRRAPTVSRRDREPGALLRYQKPPTAKQASPPAAKQATPPRPAPASVVSVAPSEPPKPGEKLHSNLGPELEGMGFVQAAVRRPIARPDDAISGIAAEAMAKAEELSRPREVEVIRPTTPEGKREKIEEIRRKELEELAELYKTAPEATPALGALVDELKRMAAERFERSGLGENLESEWGAILAGVTRPDDPTQRAVLPGREDTKTLENVLATATTPEEVSRRVAKVSEILSLRADGDQAEPLKALQNSARVMKEKGDKIIEVIAGIAETSAAKIAEVEVQLQAEGLGTQEREELTAKLAEIRQLHDSVSSVGVTETDLDTYLEAIRQVKATKNDISGLMEVSREDAERLAESYENLKGLVEELTQSQAVLDLPTDLFGKDLTRDRTYLTMISSAILSAEEQIELAGEKLEQVSGAYADRVAELGGAIADSTAEIAAKLREELQGDISGLIRFVDEVAGSAENVAGPYATLKEREYLKARREVESREIPYPGRAMTTIGDTEYEVAKERAAVKSPVEAAVALAARAKAELLKAFVRPLPVPAAVYEALQSYSGELEEILRLEQEIRDIRRQSQADKGEMEKDSKSPTAAIMIQKDIEDLERRYRQKAEAFGAATAPDEREILESEMGDLRSLIQEKERRIAENFNDPAAAAILRQNIAELKQKESQKIEALNVSKGALEERMRGELPPETFAAAESVAAPLLRAAGVSEKKWQKSTFRIAETFKFLAKVAKKMGYLVQRGISEGSPGPSAAAREHWEHTSDTVRGEFDEMASGAAQAGFQVQSEFSDAAFAVGVAAGATTEDIVATARAVGENAAVAASEAVQAVEEVKDASRETASEVAATSQANSSWVARVWRRGTGLVRTAFMAIPLASMAAGQQAVRVARPAAMAIAGAFKRAFNFSRSGGRGVFALGTAFSAVSFAASNVASSFAEMGLIDRHTADIIAKFTGLLPVVSAVLGVFGPLLTAVMGLLGALGAAVALVFNPIVLGVGAAVIAVLFLNAVLKRVFGIDLLKPFGDRIAGVTDGATGFMAEKFAWVREQFDRHLWRLTIPIQKLLNRFPQIGAAAEWVAAAWDIAISTIVNIFTGWWNKAVEIGSNLVNALNHNPTEKIPNAWDKAFAFIKGLLDDLLKKAKDFSWRALMWVGTKIKEGAIWAWRGLKEKAPEIFAGIVDSVKEAIAGIPEFFLGLFDGEWAKALGDRIAGAFSTAKETVGGWFGKKEELPEGFGQKIPAVIMGDVPEPAEAEAEAEKGWWGKAKGWAGGLFSNPFRRAPAPEPELTSGGLPAVLTAASKAVVVSAPEEKSGGFFGNLWGGIRDLWGGTAGGAKAGGAAGAPPVVFDYLDVLGDAQDAAAKAGDIDAYLAIDELLRAKAGYVTAQDIANLYEIGDAGTLVGKQIAKLNKKMERRRLYDILVGDRDPVKFLKEFAKTALPDWAYQAKWHVGEVRKEIEAMAKTGVRDLKLGVSPVDLYKPGVAEFGVQAKNLAIASGWLVRDSFGALMSGDMEKLSESWASFKGNVSYSASQISEAIKSISAATVALAIYTYLGLTPLQLGLIAAATAAVLLWRNFLGLRQVLWGLTKVAAGVGMAVAHSVEFALKAIRPLGAMLKGLLYLDVSQIKAGFADLKGVASQTLEKLRKDFALIDSGILTVGRGLRAAANQIGRVLNRLKDGLGTAIVSALTSLRDLGAGIINLGRKSRRLGESVAVGVRDWATAVRANYPEFVAAFNELISTMTAKLVAGLKSAGIKAWAALFAGFESSGEGVVALLGDVKGCIVGAVAGWSSAVRGNAPEFAAAVRQLGADGVEAFVRHFRDLARSLKAIFDTIIATVKSFVGNFDAVLKPAAALAERLARGFAPLKNLFRNPFGGGGGDVAKNAVAPFERAEESARNAIVAFDRVGDSARGVGAALVAAGNAGEVSLEQVAAATRTSLEKAGEVARAAAPAISAPIELAARQIPEGFRTAIASIPFGGIATGLREGLEKASEIAAPLAKGISKAIASGVGSLASAAFGALPDELRRAASEIGGDLSKLKETFGSASKNIAASLEAAFTNPIRELPSHIGKAVGEFRMLAEAVGATFDRIRESGKQAFDYIANRAEQDTRIVKGVVGAMGDKARADIETTKNAFGSANKKIRGFFGKTSESVRGDMGEMSAEAKVEGYEIQKNIAEGSPGTTRFIRQFWKVTGEFVGDIMKGMGRTADASGKAIAGSFESAATAARRAAKSYANPYAKGLSSPATQKMVEADHSVKPFRRPDPSRPTTRRGKRKGVGVGDLESLSMASGGLLGNFSVAAAAPLFVFQDLMDAGRAFKAFLPKLAISIANAGGVMALLSGGFAAATAAVGAFLVAAAPFVAAVAAIVAVGYLLKRAYTNNVLGLKDAVTDLKNTIVFGFRDAIASITGPLDELAANILSLFGISSEEGGSFLKLIRIVGVGLLDLATLAVAAIAVPLVKAIRTVFQVWMFAFKVALLPLRILIGVLNLVVTGIKLIVQTVKLLWEAFRFVGQAVADFLLAPFRLVYNLVAALFAKVRALMEPVGNFLTGVRDTLQGIPVIGYLFESRESAKSAGVGTDVPGYARGGLVSGTGSGTSDSILAALSDGEFVVNAAATRDNRGLLEAINGGELIDVPQVMAPSPDLPVMVAAPGGASVEDAVAARPVAVAPAEAPKQEVNITLNFNGDIVIPNATNGMEASHELLDAIGPHLRRKVMEILREMAEFRN